MTDLQYQGLMNQLMWYHTSAVEGYYIVFNFGVIIVTCTVGYIFLKGLKKFIVRNFFTNIGI